MLARELAPSPWLPFRRSPVEAPVRLLCFPFAGGGAATFRTWGKRLGPGFDVCAFEPPGRGTRFTEPAHRRMADYVDAVMPTVTALTEQRFVLFGHSMGAMVALECAKRLHRMGRAPALMVLSAYGKLPSSRKPIHQLPREELVKALHAYGGSPAEVLANEEMMEVLLPMLRADFELVETYAYQDDTSFSFPLLVVGGDDDPYFPASSLEPWRTITTGAFSFKMFPGGHFYLREAENELLATLREAIPAAP